eukprot:14109756-Alexandrium_andersonii.AAC.1
MGFPGWPWLLSHGLVGCAAHRGYGAASGVRVCFRLGRVLRLGWAACKCSKCHLRVARGRFGSFVVRVAVS